VIGRRNGTHAVPTAAELLFRVIYSSTLYFKVQGEGLVVVHTTTERLSHFQARQCIRFSPHPHFECFLQDIDSPPPELCVAPVEDCPDSGTPTEQIGDTSEQPWVGFRSLWERRLYGALT